MGPWGLGVAKRSMDRWSRPLGSSSKQRLYFGVVRLGLRGHCEGDGLEPIGHGKPRAHADDMGKGQVLPHLGPPRRSCEARTMAKRFQCGRMVDASEIILLACVAVGGLQEGLVEELR